MFTTLDFDFILKLLINTGIVMALVFGCYMRKFQPDSIQRRSVTSESFNRDHATAFILFGIGVFIVTNLLHSVDISMGFAFGLFAVFSMLRYRTESISVKEMTYLFLVIAISLLSAVGNLKPIELLALHTMIVIATFFCDAFISKNAWAERLVQYENIENIKPQNYALLVQDLTHRTGLNVERVEIIDIDFLRDTAHLKVIYSPATSASAVDQDKVSLTTIIP